MSIKARLLGKIEINTRGKTRDAGSGHLRNRRWCVCGRELLHFVQGCARVRVCACVCVCGSFSKNENYMFLFCTHSGVRMVLAHVAAHLETRVLRPPDRRGRLPLEG